MGETLYSLNDLYPGYSNATTETSVKANPETDDQDALNEDVKVAEEASTHNAKSKNILLALGVLVAVVVFLGGAK